MKDTTLIKAFMVVSALIIIIIGIIGIFIILDDALTDDDIEDMGNLDIPSSVQQQLMLLEQQLLANSDNMQSMNSRNEDAAEDRYAEKGEVVSFDRREGAQGSGIFYKFPDDPIMDLRRKNLFDIDIHSLDDEECRVVLRRTKDRIRDQENEVDDAEEDVKNAKADVRDARKRLDDAQASGNSDKIADARRRVRDAEDGLEDEEDDEDREKDFLNDLKDLKRDLKRLCD